MSRAFSLESATSCLTISTFGIDVLHLLRGGIDLLAADVLGEVDHLALQVGEIDDVEIHQADVADAGRGEIEAERCAEAAGADQQDFGGLQLELAFHADFGDDQVARVTENFVFRKRQSRCSGSTPPAMDGTSESVSASAAGVASLPR